MAIKNSVAVVAAVKTLNSMLARGRSWIRQILNSKGLDESIEYMIKFQKIINTFYYSHSIFRSPDERNSYYIY